jgi:hypothetical protein
VIGCSGSDPFVGLPGIQYGVCVGTNWLPVMGSPMPDPDVVQAIDELWPVLAPADGSPVALERAAGPRRTPAV